MKILFILGSCENRKDGVADYTIKLANTLISKNIDTRILSVNDKFIEENTIRKEILATGLEIYRLSQSKSWQSRCYDAHRYVLDFNPDWLSWQYVPFSYQSKGLPVSINKLIKEVRKDCSLHIMFHELWIDSSFPFPWRQRILGKIQKHLIKHSVATTNSSIITTSNIFYADLLQREGITAHILPLHSNIVDTSKVSRDLTKPICKNEEYLDFGFFGNILPTICKPMLQKLLIDHKHTNKNLRVFSAGRLSKSSRDIFRSLQKDYSDLADFIDLDELTEEEVAHYIKNLDICLTSYPIELIGKSGAVAAFLYYKKPVVSLGRLKTTMPCQNYVYLKSEANTSHPIQTATEFINILYTAERNVLSLSK